MNDLAASTNMTEVDYDPFASPELARAVPTTEAQRELWLAGQLGREASLAYNESVSLQIGGALDISALQNALQALSDRHEALRSTLSADGMSMLIAPSGSLQATILDLSGEGDAEQTAALARLCAEAVETPFDLTNGPLVRATLVNLGVASHQLLITSHHVICDGWSFGVLATELMTLYADSVSGKASALPLAESFGDYALTQLDAGHVKAAEADTRYWVSMYDSSLPVLELPVDHGRPALRSFASRREDMRLPAALVDGLRKCGAKQGASLFATMFAMFAGLMSRLSGQDEVVVGVPAAGQSAEAKNALVGHCVNLLPIRVTAAMEVDVESLIKGASTCVLDAYDHQSCTYGSVLKKLQLSRDPSRLPLVSVLFNVDSAIRPETLSVAGLKVELHSNPRHFENFELFLNASQVDGEVLLELQYNTELFDHATVRRWLTLYRTALERMVVNPKLLVADAFAPTGDDLALIAKFNHTQAPYPRDSRIETLIAKQAAASPEAIAVTSGAVHLNYRELEQRANALAAALRQRGVGEGHLIGLSCGRNQHMLVGMLGILKSGAGYIPLDPSFPADRLGFMAEDAGLRFVVSDRSVIEAWKFGSAERIDLDDLGAQLEMPPSQGSVEDVAYVIYTSGSTGKPKGVRVPHRTVTNLLESVRLEPGMDARHNVLSVTTLSFDIAVSEVILPLTVGARVVIADRAQATDGERLRALIETERVNFIDATPSTWRLLLAAGWQGSRELRAICTGEPLPPDLGRELLGIVGELWNGYGPTETTVWSSFYRVTEVSGTVPIGHPIANTQIHVVDAQLRLLPVGAIGELFIGGDGVTLGYLARPDLTAERFLPDPHGVPGAFWYKTGDLGRWRADGVLECLGRSDHQVKVRGYRIELGEIEANLTRHPSVGFCVVITREDQPGDVRLVAYVVPRTGTVYAETLRDFLRQTLPDYMIPQHVIELAAIPLLPNGKINRQALPKPEVDLLTGGTERVAPRNPLEQQLLTMMEQVLNLPGLAVRDNFFAMGGHSLLAAKLTSRLNKELDLNLPLRTVFESPTVEALALAVEKARGLNMPRRKAIVHQADQCIAPLTVMQERIRFMEEMQPGRVLYNTPSAHRLTGPMDVVAFGCAFAQMLQRQPSLRSVIAPVTDGSGHLLRVLDQIDASIPFEDLSMLGEAEREAEVLLRMQAIIDQPINIMQAPLFRVALYKMASDQHIFLFMPHHIIWDGWSFDLLYQEMSTIYPAALENRSPTLPVPPVSYVDFAHWHDEWMRGDECRAQLQFWKQRYANIETPRSMPTDRPRSAGMTGTGATEWVHVDKTLTEQLREVALLHTATLNMLVMAVYAVMMSQVLGGRSLVIGVPVRGRLTGEVESVMGFFNNLLPAHLDVDPARTLGEWILAVKRELMDSFANQEVPFERLAAEPEIARHANKAGLYQSLFSFQDARERERAWGSLKHQSVLVMQKGATEDFGLWLMEVPTGLEGGINYNADLFDAPTAQLFHERLVALLQRVAATPNITLQALMVAPGEDASRLAAWVSARHAARDKADAARSAAKENEPPKVDTQPPQTDVEKLLAAIWCNLLNIPGVSCTDNFFDLGGHSLLAMQAIAAMESKTGKHIEPNRYIFETLGQIARWYDTAEAENGKKQPSRLRRVLSRLVGT